MINKFIILTDHCFTVVYQQEGLKSRERGFEIASRSARSIDDKQLKGIILFTLASPDPFSLIDT